MEYTAESGTLHLYYNFNFIYDQANRGDCLFIGWKIDKGDEDQKPKLP